MYCTVCTVNASAWAQLFLSGEWGQLVWHSLSQGNLICSFYTWWICMTCYQCCTHLLRTTMHAGMLCVCVALQLTGSHWKRLWEYSSSSLTCLSLIAQDHFQPLPHISYIFLGKRFKIYFLHLHNLRTVMKTKHNCGIHSLGTTGLCHRRNKELLVWNGWYDWWNMLQRWPSEPRKKMCLHVSRRGNCFKSKAQWPTRKKKLCFVYTNKPK